MSFWKRKPKPNQAIEAEEIIETRSKKPSRSEIINSIVTNNFSIPEIKGIPANEPVATMDAEAFGQLNGMAFGGGIPDGMLQWFGNQSFIGYQVCMLLAQHWLINAACEIPVQDALRKGHEIKSTDGEDIDVKILAKLKKFNKLPEVNINERAENFGKFARVFGIRIAIFIIESTDDKYYEKPYNPDGITKDSYKGIAMPDPYYCSPILKSGFSPTDPSFYEPEFWLVQGKKYHKSHCIIYRHCTVPMLLKPNYLYGGVSLPQQIFEKVYQAESASNEANRLLMTKRLLVRKGDIMAALTDQIGFEEKLEFFQKIRDNYGEQCIDTTEDVVQLETSLSEVTNVIAQRYEQVAAIARMPVNKLLMIQLSGFGSSGDSEESTYGELLESLQEKCLGPLLERHYEIAIRSEGIEPFDFEIHWPPTDTLTEKEQAEINQINASTDQIHANIGALSGDDIRHRLIRSKDTGYQGISEAMPEIDYAEDNDPEDDRVITQDSKPIAAGILFMTDAGETLFLKRGNQGDNPGLWGLPFGHIEPGETPEQAARREAKEETGINYTGTLTLANENNGCFTYIARIKKPLPTKINAESAGYIWTKPSMLADRMHPNLALTLEGLNNGNSI